MAGNNVDWLSVEVTSSATSAISEIKNLAKALDTLEKSVEKTSISKSLASDFRLAGVGISNMAQSLRGLDAKRLRDIGSGLTALASGINNVNKAIHGLDFMQLANQSKRVSDTFDRELAKVFDEFGIKGKRNIANVRDELYNFERALKSGDKSPYMLELLDKATKSIQNNARFAKSELAGLSSESQAVLSTMRASGKGSILIDPNLKSEVADTMATLTAFTSKFTTEAGKATTNLSTFLEQNKQIFGIDPHVIGNEADQFAKLAEVINMATAEERDAKSVSIGFGEAVRQFGFDADAAGKAIFELYDSVMKEEQAQERAMNSQREQQTVLAGLKTSYKQFADSMRELSGIEVPGAEKASSITALAQAISKLGNTSIQGAIDNLPHLTRELNNMMTVLSKSPAVKDNIIQMTNALANLASQGQKVGTATNALANGMNRNTSNGFRSASSAMRGTSAIGKTLANTFRNITSQNVKLCSSLGALRKGLSFVNPQKLLSPLMKISGVIGTIYASCFMFFGLFRKMKEAIAYAADLTEIQHIVDVQFGEMKDKVEDFTKTSIKDFGINEKSAKNYASIFQSMGNAIGITGAQVAGAQKHLSQFKTPYGAVNGYNELSNSMADMSINLTKLTADISSFYNVSQDEVAKALQSGIFAGQTRPLRQFGVDLTQATLQEWALTNGIKANFKTMTQAEKTMLRYAYTMERLGVAQGDYAQTSKTWANQVRLLKQQFQQLGAVVGQGLIQWLKPFLIGMNEVLSRVIEFATKVVNALGKIFGWEIELGAGAIDTDLEEAIGDYTDLGNAVDGTTESIKELNKQVQGFDKLNILTTNKNGKNPSTGTGTGTGSGTGSGADAGALAQLKKTKGLFESEIDNLYELGETIRDALIHAMDSIDWDSVYKKASNFGKGLAEFLNGLFSNDKQGNNVFSKTGETIAKALGAGLTALNEFAKTFKWKDFGTNLASGFIKFAEKMDWGLSKETFKNLGTGIADALNGLFGSDKDGNNIFKAAGKTLAGTLNTVIAGSLAFATTFDWSTFGTNLASGLTEFLKDFDWSAAGKNFHAWMQGIKTSFKSFVKYLADHPDEIIGAIKDFFSEITIEDVGILIGIMTIKKIATWALGGGVKALAETAIGGLFKNVGIAIGAKITGMTFVEATGAAGAGTLGASVGASVLTSVKSALGTAFTGAGLTLIESTGAATVGGALLTLGAPVAFAMTPLIGQSILTDIHKKAEKEGDKVTKEIIENAWGKKGTVTKDSDGKYHVSQEVGIDFDGTIKWVGDKIKNFFSWLADKLFPDKDEYTVNGKKIGITYNAGVDISGTVKWIGEKITSFLSWLAKKLFPDKTEYTVNGKNVSVSYNSDISFDGAIKWVGEKIGNFGTWLKEKIFGKDKKGSEPDVNATVGLKKGWTTSLKEFITGEEDGTFYGGTASIGRKKNWDNNKSPLVSWITGVKNGIFHGGTANISRKKNWNGKKYPWKKWVTGEKDGKFHGGTANISRKKNWSGSLKEWITGDKKGIIDVTISIAVDAAAKNLGENIAKSINSGWEKFNKKTHKKADGGVFTSSGWKPIQGYATGGMPNSAEVFMARENGLPEMVGTIGGHTAVMNNDQIVASVSNGVARANAEQNELLRTQNALLRQLLAKETGISSRDVFNACRSENNNYRNRTGKSAFAF